MRPLVSPRLSLVPGSLLLIACLLVAQCQPANDNEAEHKSSGDDDYLTADDDDDDDGGDDDNDNTSPPDDDNDDNDNAADDDDATPDDDDDDDDDNDTVYEGPARAEGAAALALDAAGFAHIAFLQAQEIWILDWVTAYTIMLADNLAGSWSVGVARQLATSDEYSEGESSAIAVDSAGVAHLSYNRWGYVEYRSIPDNGQGAQFSFAGEHRVTKIAADADGYAHIVYGVAWGADARDYTPLWHSTNRSGAWITKTLADVDTRGANIAAGADGRLYILYLEAPNLLKLIVGDGDSWEAPVVVAAANVRPQDFAAAAEADGGVHVVYVDGGRGLVYTTNRDGPWNEAVLDETAGDAQPMIGLDEAQTVQTVHMVGDGRESGRIRHLRFPIGYPGSAGFSYVGSCSPSEPKLCGSLGVRADGVPFVAFVYNGMVFCARNSGGGWTTEVVYLPIRK